MVGQPPQLVRVFAIVLVCLWAVGVAASPVVTDIRVGTYGPTTRIVFEFTDKLTARVFALADPYRVVVDLPEVGWRLPARPLPAAAGAYDKLRYGLYKPGNSRVVLDLLGPAVIAKAAMLAPNGAYGYRLVLELAGSNRATFLTARKAGEIAVSAAPLGPAPATFVAAPPPAAIVDAPTAPPALAARTMIAKA
ncbi:MAG: AMIN domain-containing protein, partial [Rhodospirillaceae bacterium]